MYSFGLFKTVQTLKNTKDYETKVWDKSKTTWAVGIEQLTPHSGHGWGKSPSTFGFAIFAPTANLVVSLLRNTDRPCRFAI